MKSERIIDASFLIERVTGAIVPLPQFSSICYSEIMHRRDKKA